MTPRELREMVSRSRNSIRAGDIIQVVLSHRLSARNPLDPVDLYRALRFVKAPYLFFLKMEDVHLIGSSPGSHGPRRGRLCGCGPSRGQRRRR